MKSFFTRTALILGTLATLAASQNAFAHGGGHGGGGGMRSGSGFYQAAPLLAQSPQSYKTTKPQLASQVATTQGNQSILTKFNSTNATAGSFKLGSNDTGVFKASSPVVGNLSGKGIGSVIKGTSSTGGTATGTGSTGTAGSGKGTKGSNGNSTGGSSTGTTTAGASSDASGSGGILSNLLSMLSGSGSGSGSDGGGSSGGGSSGGGDNGSYSAAPAATPAATAAPAASAVATTQLVSTTMPASPANSADLVPIDIRLIDSGVPAEKLGPRYRVTVVNNSTTNVNQEFTVRVAGSQDATPGANLPGAVKRVSGLDAGATTAVDLRLPAGLKYPFVSIVVDAEQEVPDANRDNNSAVISVEAIGAPAR